MFPRPRRMRHEFFVGFRGRPLLALGLSGRMSRRRASALVGFAYQSSSLLKAFVRLRVVIGLAVVHLRSRVAPLLVPVEVKQQVGHTRVGLWQGLALEFHSWELLTVPGHRPLRRRQAQHLTLGGSCALSQLRSSGRTPCGVPAAEHG